MYQATTTQAVASHNIKAPPKSKKMTKSAAIEMSDALSNTETAAEYVSTALKLWNGPKPSASPDTSKKSQMKYDVFDPKQAAELLHMHQFDPQLYQVPQSMQSMQIPTHYVAQPTQYVLEPAQYEEQEQMPQHYHPTTLTPQVVTLQPIIHKKPIEMVETEPPTTQAPRYARPAIRKPSKPVRQKAPTDNAYELYDNVVTVTKPEPFELHTAKAPPQKEVTAESQRTTVRNPTSTYTVQEGGETHIHHHYAPVHHQQYEEQTVDVQEHHPRPKYVAPRARTKPSTHTFQIQHHQATSEEPYTTPHEHTTSYRVPSHYQQTLKATSRPLTHQTHSSLASEVEKELSQQTQSYQIEIPREELIKHIEDSVNKYLKNLNLEDKLAKERPRPSYVPRPQQHVMIVSTTPPPPPPPPTTTPAPTTPRPVKIPRRRRPVVMQQPQPQPQQEVNHDHQEQHIIVSSDDYIPPSYVVHQGHPSQVSHPEPIVVTQPAKIYTYEETPEPQQEQVYRQPKVIHQEQYQAQYTPGNELARESVVHNIDLTDQNAKSRPNHIDLSALDVGQSWSHGNSFDHSAALKNLQGFDQSNAVLQPSPHPKLHFNSQTYHDINALPYNPNRDFVSTVEPPAAASMQADASTTFFKKQSFGPITPQNTMTMPMPGHNTVNVNEGQASVGASISVGGEQSVPGLRDEQVKSITDELGPVHIINGLPVVNPYNIDLHTLKFMLGSPMAPGNTNEPHQQSGPSSVSEVPPPAHSAGPAGPAMVQQKPKKNIQYTRELGWTNSIRSPAASASNPVQYKYTGNDLQDSYSPKFNNNPKGDGFQTFTGSKVQNAHQNGPPFDIVPKGRLKLIETKPRGKRTQVKGREPDTELKPPPRFPKYN